MSDEDRINKIMNTINSLSPTAVNTLMNSCKNIVKNKNINIDSDLNPLGIYENDTIMGAIMIGALSAIMLGESDMKPDDGSSN